MIFPLLFLIDKTKQTISVSLMSLSAAYSSDKGAIFASICVFVLPMIIAYILFLEKVEQGISWEAVKG